MEKDEMQTLCVSRDNKAIYQISAQYIEAYRKKVRKTRILSPKRGITHSNFDEIRHNMNLICESSLQSHL